MAEMNSLSSVNAALAGLMDMKSRGSDADNLDNGKNFTDMMMARVTAQQSSKDDIQATVKDYESSAASDDDVPRWVQNLKQAKPGRDDYERRAGKSAAAEKPAPKEKGAFIAAKPEQKNAAPEDAPVTTDTSVEAVTDVSLGSLDTKALDGLKKMAAMLLEAEKNGKLVLPANVKGVLEKIAGTASNESGQVLPLLQNLLTALRKLEDSKGLAELQKNLGEATWPADLTKLFTELQVNPGIKADQPISLGKLIKGLRMLAHLAQRAIKESLNKTLEGMPEEALLAVGVNASKPAEKEASAGVAVDIEGSAKKDKTAASAVDALVSDAMAAPMNTPNSQKQPSLGNNPLSPSVDATLKGEAKLGGAGAKGGHKSADLPDVRDAFAKGAQAERGNTRGLGSAANPLISSKAPVLEAPAAEPAAPAPSSSTHINAAVMANRLAASAPAVTPALPSPVTQQVLVHIQKSGGKDTQLSIELHPAELGRVDVRITIGRDGKATAHIVADRPETLAMLQKDGNHLEKALHQAGLSSSAQDLHYSLRDQAQQRSGDPGGRRKRSLFEGDEEAKTIAVDTTVRDDGLPHRVNYHA